MFGSKINEFDNSNGKRKTFNNIFPKTKLSGDYGEYVEIGDIVEKKDMFLTNPFVREISFYDHNYNYLGTQEHDFGEDNFRPDMYLGEDNVRFKYTAYDLDNKKITTAFNIPDLAKNLGCSESLIKTRLKKKIGKQTKSNCLFNVKRIEL